MRQQPGGRAEHTGTRRGAQPSDETRIAGADALGPAAGLLPHLLAASPDRVVSSPVGRIEVSGPIQRAVPSGPHTHLLPDLLAQERLLEPGFALPEGYVACATLVRGG